MKETVLITGANGALGSELVKYFSERNYLVIGVVRPGHTMENKEGIIYFEADLNQEDSVQKLMQAIDSKKLKLKAGILVAGGFAMKKFLNTQNEDLQSMLDKNFFSAFFIAKHLLEHMRIHNEHSKIIFIGARPALEKGGEATTAYTLSKSLLLKMVEIINEAANKTNVQAALIAPAVLDTESNRRAMPNEDFSLWVKPIEIAGIMEQIMIDEGVRRDIVIKAYKDS